MKFKWKSFRTVYAMFCCSSLLSYALITVAYNFTKQITIESFGMAISSWSYLLLINYMLYGTCCLILAASCVFYSSNTTVIISFFFLARKWPMLIAKWTEVEEGLVPKSQIQPGRQLGKQKLWWDWKLSTKVRVVTAAIFSLCFIEHSLSVKRYFYFAENCPQVTDRRKAIFVQHFTELFYFSTYTLPKAIWARFMITICVFTWTYMDCFVSLVGVGISSGFYRINSQMRVVKGMVSDMIRWG